MIGLRLAFRTKALGNTKLPEHGSVYWMSKIDAPSTYLRISTPTNRVKKTTIQSVRNVPVGVYHELVDQAIQKARKDTQIPEGLDAMQIFMDNAMQERRNALRLITIALDTLIGRERLIFLLLKKD